MIGTRNFVFFENLSLKIILQKCIITNGVLLSVPWRNTENIIIYIEYSITNNNAQNNSEIRHVVLTWRENSLINNFIEFTEITDNRWLFVHLKI
jgi:hypothetical protein